jgi:hypothetical protein
MLQLDEARNDRAFALLAVVQVIRFWACMRDHLPPAIRRQELWRELERGTAVTLLLDGKRYANYIFDGHT